MEKNILEGHQTLNMIDDMTETRKIWQCNLCEHLNDK